MEHILPRQDRRQSAESRLLYGLAGGALMAYGIKRKSLFGGLLSVVGADLFSRGATGHHLYEAVGVTDHAARYAGSRTPHQVGIQVQRSITVSVSPEEAYRFVRNLENLPRFMKHLISVREIDAKQSHWLVKGPEGMQVEWDAEIINEIPGELIAWRSIKNPHVDNAGSLRFTKGPADRGTIIRVSLQYMPPAGAVGAAIAKLFGEEPELQIRSDLRRLKQILEAGEVATARGQLAGGVRRRVGARSGDGKEGQEESTAACVPVQQRRSAAASGARR
jgi:uncharacterized membrane protein